MAPTLATHRQNTIDRVSLEPSENSYLRYSVAGKLFTEQLIGPTKGDLGAGSQRVWPSSAFPGRRRHEVTANRCGWDRPTRDGIAGGVLATDMAIRNQPVSLISIAWTYTVG